MTNSNATEHLGITFAVDEVSPATRPLREGRAYEAVKETLAGTVNSGSDYHGAVVADVDYQPLLAAVYLAYSEHRPLVLTPGGQPSHGSAWRAAAKSLRRTSGKESAAIHLRGLGAGLA